MPVAEKYKYDIAVVIINYNSSAHTIACVQSILEHTGTALSYEVIVVDNCSAADDYAAVRTLDALDKVRVVRSKINLGFALGNMYGLQFAQAKYYFILNNDCQLLNDCLTILFTFCESHPRVGLCSPQMYSPEQEAIPCCDYFPVISSKILGTGIFRLLKGRDYYYRKKVYTEPVKVDVISGSQMFVRGSVFNDLGGLDTNFFLYCEEEDLALRVHQAGFDTYIVPAAKNIHVGGASTQRNLAIRKEFYISFFYLYRKHFGVVKTEILRLTILARLLKKIFSGADNFKLLKFVLSGASLANSMRHKQKIVDRD